MGTARRPEGEDLIQRRWRDPWRFRQQGQQSLDFRSEQQSLALAAVEQRQNADPVPNQQQALPAGVPQREGKLAVQVLHEIVAILLVGMDDDFGVAVGAEPVSRVQQDLAQLDVIENLAVERDPDGPVLVGHGLSAAFEINDAQAGVAQADPTIGVEVDAAAIRTAMAQGRQHAAYIRLADPGLRRERDEAGNTAHDESYAGTKAALTLIEATAKPSSTSLAGANRKSPNNRPSRASHRCKFV